MGGQTGRKVIMNTNKLSPAMKKMQSDRIDAETIKQIDKIGEIEKRTKSNVIEIAVEKYYQKFIVPNLEPPTD